MKFRECCSPFSSGRNGAREDVHGGIIGLKRWEVLEGFTELHSEEIHILHFD